MKHIEIDLRQLKSGNERAWNALFEEHYAVMCHLAFQYVRDDFTAESLVSDVISHIWENRAKLSLDTSLRNYLLQSTRNRCIDYLRSFYFKNMTSVSEELMLRNDVLDMTQPLGILLASEFEAYVNEAIESLPNETRIVFEKSRNEGLRYDEISAELGISINTVKYHIKRSLLLIRESLSYYLNQQNR